MNLVSNGSFAQGLNGWEPIWAREDGTARATVMPGRAAGLNAVLVTATGEKDWALAQESRVSVKPGEIYKLSAWMKTEGGTGTISIVTRDAKGQTLDWGVAATGPGQTGWQFVHRAFGIPAGCRTIQFRIVGYGAGKTWVEAPSLIKVGAATAHAGKAVTLAGGGLTLKIGTDGSMQATTKHGRSWQYRGWPADYALQALTSTGARTARIQALDFANDLPISLEVEVDALRAEATISYRASGSQSVDVALPGSLVTNAGQWLIVPMNEGIRLPVEDRTLNGWSLITYGGHGLCMPWTGVVDPATGQGAMTILQTPNDADMVFQHVDGRMTFQPRWEPSRLAFSYQRKLKLEYFDKGGFVAMAKRYRTYAKETGLFKTLEAKRKENANVDRLIGAVNVWNWDMDKVALCREMKQMGFEHVLWSSGGTPEQVRDIAALGYLPGRYDIYQDLWDPKHSLSWQPTEGWPEDLVYEPNGDWMKGWAHPDKHPDGSITWYQGGVINSARGLQRAKTKIPSDLAKTPYLARFIDTTTASPFREDYNTAHPLTRTQDRENKMALLEFCSKNMKQVVGTETGIDPSVPYVEYYEGMMSLGPFRLPDSGTFMMDYQKPTPQFLKFQVGPTYRIPLWELVYHDCTVAQWYWGDASNKEPEVWDQRDLLNILYGTAPLLMFDKARWERDHGRMLQTYRNVCEWVRKIGYDEMVSHEDLIPDHSVQRTTWSSGRSVTVNFGSTPFRGMTPMSFDTSQ